MDGPWIVNIQVWGGRLGHRQYNAGQCVPVGLRVEVVPMAWVFREYTWEKVGFKWSRRMGGYGCVGGQCGKTQGSREHGTCRGAPGNTMEGKGYLYKFPTGEKVHASMSQDLRHHPDLLAVRP